MTSAITVRRFEAGDSRAVLDLATRLTIGVAPWRDQAKVLTAVRGWVEASIRAAHDDDHAVFVALIGDEVVGAITAREQAHWSGEVDAYVDELVTAEGSEGRGVAGALLKLVEEWARERGLTVVTLETGIRNVRARCFYRCAGFEEEEIRLTKQLSR